MQARRAAAAAFTVLVAVGVVRPPPGAAGVYPTVSCPTWKIAAVQNYSPNSVLTAVSTSSDPTGGADPYAAGRFTDQGATGTLLGYWTGLNWYLNPGPDAAGDDLLQAIGGTSYSDFWAVGFHGHAPAQTLAVHIDGQAQQVVGTPNVGPGDNQLLGVADIAPDDVWAVGWYSSAGLPRTLTEHYDGNQWTVVPSPNGGSGGNQLFAVSAVSSADVWAVGSRTAGGGGLRSLTEHWNGTRWRVQTSPDLAGDDELAGVTAVSASDVWAVGTLTNGGLAATLAEHWDGTAWTVEATEDPGAGNNRLRRVSAVSFGDIWAVGDRDAGPGTMLKTLIEHYDGTAWSVTPGPKPGGAANTLLDVSAYIPPPKGTVIGHAVGYVQPDAQTTAALGEVLCEALLHDANFYPDDIRAPLGSPVTWNVDRSDSAAHAVSDGSGMGLFDSGLRPPGASFTFVFTTAGTYPVIDTQGPATASVGIPMAASPKRGGTATRFTLTWASDALPPGYVVDVRVKRPGQAFTGWKQGLSSTGSTFTPDGGTGKYSFEARLRNTANGHASAYSPPAAISVR